jgi:hypothetical protein
MAFDTDNDATAESAIALAPQHFSWSATLAGGVIAVGVTLVLLVLGSGLGLELVPREAAGGQLPHSVFTLGAIYFLAAQAFGLAVGAHVAGRLIGPAIETSNEENFRAGAHGLAVWAVAILITLLLVAATSSLAAKSAVRFATLYGASAQAGPQEDQASSSAYFVDVLFRPQGGTNGNAHASLDWTQYAQADTSGTDAAPGGGQGPSQQPDANGPPNTFPNTMDEVPGGQSEQNDGNNGNGQNGSDNGLSQRVIRHVPGDLAPQPPPTTAPQPAQLAADKAEVGRILDAAWARGGSLAVEDRDRIAQLVAQDTNISYEQATSRANDVETRQQAARDDASDRGRKAGGFAALWLAVSLIFGLAVSVIASISARWEDDMQTMFVFRRSAA